MDQKHFLRKLFFPALLIAFTFLILPSLLSLTLNHIHPALAEREAMIRLATTLTAKLSLYSGMIGITIGFLVGVFGLNSTSFTRRSLAGFYVWLICGTPLVIQVLFFFYGLPAILPLLTLDELQAGICALSLNMGAYSATVVKAGLDAVPKQQYEAGISLGLTRIQTLRWIILPQSIRIVLGPLLNNWVALLKDTSLVSAIGVAELTLTATRINSETFLPIPTLITVGLIYLVMSSMLNLCALMLKTKNNQQT